MILELAILNVRHGESRQFEEAFGEAKSIISAAEGFDHLELRRCLENPDRYVLLVAWDHLEDHTEGFRRSEAYQLWKSLLHHFYEPFPVVEHYEPLVEVGRPSPG
jgi:heme-degrading monooxygenase HmoA